MKKTEKRPYLHPTTEVVRFTADIITTSITNDQDNGIDHIPDDGVTYSIPEVPQP